VLSCGAAKVALWLYARGYDLYAVKTELRAYGFGDARYFADLMRDGPDGACELAKVEAGRAGNRDAAKAVRCLLPSRDDWREWTGTQTARQKQRYARSARDAEMIAYYAYLHAVDRPGVIATDPVAGLLYGAGIGLPRQPEGSAV
jgi:hypothetical protein